LNNVGNILQLHKWYEWYFRPHPMKLELCVQLTRKSMCVCVSWCNRLEGQLLSIRRTYTKDDKDLSLQVMHAVNANDMAKVKIPTLHRGPLSWSFLMMTDRL